jgi:hypothetical protein
VLERNAFLRMGMQEPGASEQYEREAFH